LLAKKPFYDGFILQKNILTKERQQSNLASIALLGFL
jgi:hypothetical protein